MPSRLLVTLNARLRPLDRGERYEDPLQGPRETALYLYGPSATQMRELVSEVLERFPLALTLPSR